MADVYKPHPCTEREALERLAAEARRGAHYLERARLQMDASEWRRVTLWTIDQVGQATTPADAVDLERALPRLLVNRSLDSGATAIASDEYILIGGQLEPRSVVDVLRRLEAFATPARVSRLQTAAGEDVWLVHLLVDPRRWSGFNGLKALGLFAGWSELRCYPADGLRVFVPADISVPDDLFQAFSTMPRFSSSDFILRGPTTNVSTSSSGRHRPPSRPSCCRRVPSSIREKLVSRWTSASR
jgi:hypothetical protein